MKKNVFFIFTVILVLFLTGCASSVKVDVTRPAELDLGGAKSVSVLEFKPSATWSGSNVYRRGQKVSILDFFFGYWDTVSDDEEYCIYELKNSLEKKILESGYLTLISSNIVEKELNRGSKVSADVYLVGQITNFDVKDKEETTRHTDDDDNVYYTTEYIREVKMEFYCEIIDSASNTIRGYKNFSYSNSSFREDKRSRLPSASSLMANSISYAVGDLMKALEPYTETKVLKLLSHKSEAMKNADKMVKNGLLSEGGRNFLKIYNSENLYEAGYNAAIILEALGKYNSAEELMEEVAKKFGEKKAYNALKDIRNEKKLYEKLQEQTLLHDGVEETEESREDAWMSDFDEAPAQLNFDDIVW
ncbi:MAG: PDDEXK-like family protein [Treponema sp.]|nr:PDDEXK-like family protein [Treponema sp.]